MSVFFPKRLSASPESSSLALFGAGLHLAPFVFQPERLRNKPAVPYIREVPSRL
jgi:hypothetical protein